MYRSLTLYTERVDAVERDVGAFERGGKGDKIGKGRLLFTRGEIYVGTGEVRPAGADPDEELASRNKLFPNRDLSRRFER